MRSVAVIINSVVIMVLMPIAWLHTMYDVAKAAAEDQAYKLFKE